MFFLFIIGLIFAIDPYDRYGINVFGFETKAVAMARENKFYMLENAKKNYEAFIIGSSSAHRYSTKIVKELTGLETFNYAVQHTTPEDYLAITNHILSKYNPKLFIISLDLYLLNENFPTDTRFYTSPLKNYLSTKSAAPKSEFDLNYLTLEAIRDSLKVIYVNLKKSARHIYLADGNYNENESATGKVKVTQFSYSNYVFSKKRIEILKQIKSLCMSKNIKLVVFTSPLSLEHYQKIISQPDLKLVLDNFKETIQTIFGNFHDFLKEDLKNYDTTEYFLDSTHPSQKFSSLVLEKLLKTP